MIIAITALMASHAGVCHLHPEAASFIIIPLSIELKLKLPKIQKKSRIRFFERIALVGAPIQKRLLKSRPPDSR